MVVGVLVVEVPRAAATLISGFPPRSARLWLPEDAERHPFFICFFIFFYYII